VKSKVMVIGLDGATFKILDPMISRGKMPNLAELIKTGTFGELKSVIPPNSMAAWASFMSGKKPGKHSIFGFRIPDSSDFYRKRVVHSKVMKSETLWRILSRNSKKVGVINVPLTYPPQPVNGFLISGMLTPSTNSTFTYPEELGKKLKEKIGDYPINLVWKWYKNRVSDLIEDVKKMTTIRKEATLFLLDLYQPDFCIVVFTGPDRVQHCLWKYIDGTHPEFNAEESKKYMPLIDEFFMMLDSAIGEIRARLDEDTVLILISDHGFQSAHKQFDVNDWLMTHHLLKFRKGKARTLAFLRALDIPFIHKLRRQVLRNLSGRRKILSPKSQVSWKNTKAYCAGDQQVGIQVNLRGREPEGIVSQGEEYEKLRSFIKQALLNTRDPQNNHAVIRDVFYREEYFNGPFSDLAPDLVFHTYENYATSPYKKRLYELTGWASGDHSLEGIFIAHGKIIQKGKQFFGAEIVDLFPTILHMLKIGIPIDTDGKVLKGIFQDSFSP